MNFKKIYHLILSLAVLSTFEFSIADSPWANRLDQNQLEQQGRLIQIKIVPERRQLQVFLVGKKGAQFSFSKAKLKASFKTADGDLSPLQVERGSDHFKLPGKSKTHAQTLILEAEVEKGSEVFLLDLK